MAREYERIQIANKAWGQLDELLQVEHPTVVERDASILRFEFTFETVWKAAKEVLFVREGVSAGSPKSVIRACRDAGILDDEQTVLALRMVDDRNLSVHTYNEDLAQQIYLSLRSYRDLMRLWLDQMSLER